MEEKDKKCLPDCELCARDNGDTLTDDSDYESTYPEDPDDEIDEDGEQELREFLG